MTKVHLYNGPRHGEAMEVGPHGRYPRKGQEWRLIRVGEVSIVRDLYRITDGPDDAGHFGAAYISSED